MLALAAPFWMNGSFNVFNQSPWVLYSTGLAAPDTNYVRVYLRGVTLRGYTAAGNKARINANGVNGPTVIELVGNASLTPVVWAAPYWCSYVTQPYLSQLDSGQVVIFTD